MGDLFDPKIRSQDAKNENNTFFEAATILNDLSFLVKKIMTN